MTTSGEIQDTSTHRLTIAQLSMTRVQEFVSLLQSRRAIIAEKVARIKKNSVLDREAKINKQLARLFKQLDTLCSSIESDLDTAADKLNKSRGLFLELSGGSMALERTELTNGSIATRAADRGNSSSSAT